MYVYISAVSTATLEEYKQVMVVDIILLNHYFYSLAMLYLLNKKIIIPEMPRGILCGTPKCTGRPSLQIGTDHRGSFRTTRLECSVARVFSLCRGVH